MIPIEWKLIGAGVGVVALLVAAFGIEHHGYDRGVAATQAAYEKKLADQAAANKAAVDGANKQLLETADALAAKNKGYDDALAHIDATAGGAGGDLCGLDAGRVFDLNAVGGSTH